MWMVGGREGEQVQYGTKAVKGRGPLAFNFIASACVRARSGADSASRGAERGSRGMVVMVGALEVAGSPLPFQLQTVLSIIS